MKQVTAFRADNGSWHETAEAAVQQDRWRIIERGLDTLFPNTNFDIMSIERHVKYRFMQLFRDNLEFIESLIAKSREIK